MSAVGSLSARPGLIYWVLVGIAPLSIFTAASDVPPIFVWLFFTLGFVASVNRIRYSEKTLGKIVAGLTALLYGGLLGFLFYVAIAD